MPSVKSNGFVGFINKSWKIISLIIILGGILSTFFASQATLKDSIDTKIEKNDTLDCERFAKKDEFKELKAETKALAIDVDEIKIDVKDLKQSMATQIQILIRMEERLKRRDTL
jgi:hypothetical protein